MINPSSPVAPANDLGFNMKPGSPEDALVPAEPKAGEPCQECLAAKAAKYEVIHVRISLFFDGTLNNRANSYNRDSEYDEGPESTRRSTILFPRPVPRN